MTIFLAAFMASLSIAAPDLLADASQKRKLQILMDLDPHFPKPIAKIVADYSYESNGMVSAGDFHTCVVKADGTIRCWGDNSDGQAVVPAGFISGVSQVSAGYDQTCVVKADGTLGCWGRNQHGQATVPAGFISLLAPSLADAGERKRSKFSDRLKTTIKPGRRFKAFKNWVSSHLDLKTKTKP